MIEKVKDAITDKLAAAIVSVRSVEEAYRFLSDLCTISEITEMSKRLTAAEMLRDGNTYNEIAEKTGLRPFLVKKYLDGAKKYSEDFLTDRIIKIAEIDLNIKEGLIPEWTALEQYIIESVQMSN